MKIKLKYFRFYAALFLVFSTVFSSYGQYDSTRVRQQIQAYGYEWKNALFKHSLIIPKDTTKMAIQDSGAIATLDKKLLMWDGYVWSEISGSGGVTDTVMLYPVEVDTVLNAMIFSNNYGDKDTILFVGGGSGGGGGGVDTLYNRSDSLFFVKNSAEYYLGEFGFDTTTIYNTIATKLNISDTANKWVADVVKINDSTLRVYKGGAYSDIVLSSGVLNFPTVNDTLTANRQLYIDSYLLDFKNSSNHVWRLSTTGWSYSGSGFNNILNGSYQEYVSGTGSTYGMLKTTSSSASIYSQNTGSVKSYVSAYQNYVDVYGQDSVRITHGIDNVALDTSIHKMLVRTASGRLYETDVPSGGAAMSDTIYAENGIEIKTRNDSTFIRLVDDWVIDTAYTDTVIITASSAPNGNPNHRMSVEKIGRKSVQLGIWLSWDNSGSSVSAFTIPLPAWLPEPKLITGRSSNNTYVYFGSGAMSTTLSGTQAMANVAIKRNSDNSGWEIEISRSSGTYRYVNAMINYFIE